MRDRKKRNIIIGSLCCLLVFMGIGYAVLSQTLNISGTANMKGTWDIKITDMSEASRTGKADPGTPTISSSGVSASFEANLWMPGDSITYNITVKNNGNIDAALKELVPSVENGVQQVKFSNNAVQGKVLRQKESYTFQVSVVFDEDATEIPQDSKTNPPKYTISLTFVQYTGNSLYTPVNDTTDNSCFIIDTDGKITNYDKSCGTVVTIPAEIDGIKVKSIAKNAFAEQDSFNVWAYSKEESADVTKTYYIFKDQNARSLFLEMQGITQEELDAMAESDNIYNYLKGDSALNGLDLGTLVTSIFIYKNSDGEITAASPATSITELDLSHAKYLENIDFDYDSNLKRLNLNTANVLTFESFESGKELEELIINADVFNNTKSSGNSGDIFGGTHIKKLIILDGKVSHKLDISTDKSGLFYYTDTDIENGIGIENIIIDDGITELGTKSLYRLDIKSITLPSTLTIIGNEALRNNELTNLAIPSSVKIIGNYAFSGNKLTSLTIPSSVETIGSHSFYGNILTSLTIPASVETIGERAFDWNKLTSVTIPASVETIGDAAFSTNLLTTINFEPNSKLKTIGYDAFEDNRLASVTIPSSVETIGAGAFSHNLLTTINFEPNSKLKTIGGSAFEYTKLTNVTIPASVETIGNRAFWEIPLTTINFEPNSKLKTIGEEAFYYTKLTNVTIPASVETIGKNAFSTNLLTTINFEPNSKLKTIGSYAFESNKLTSLKIPLSVETIGSYAFESNKLTSLTIPASVEIIDDDAFRNNQITTINFELNSKLKTIGNSAFAYNQLTNVGLGKLPSSLTRLDTYAFYGNSNLTQIVLTSPSNVKKTDYDSSVWSDGDKIAVGNDKAPKGATIVYER